MLLKKNNIIAFCQPCVRAMGVRLECSSRFATNIRRAGVCCRTTSGMYAQCPGARPAGGTAGCGSWCLRLGQDCPGSHRGFVFAGRHRSRASLGFAMVDRMSECHEAQDVRQRLHLYGPGQSLDRRVVSPSPCRQKKAEVQRPPLRRAVCRLSIRQPKKCPDRHSGRFQPMCSAPRCSRGRCWRKAGSGRFR